MIGDIAADEQAERLHQPGVDPIRQAIGELLQAIAQLELQLMLCLQYVERPTFAGRHAICCRSSRHG